MANLFVKSGRAVDADVDAVWGALLDADFARRLFTVPFESKLVVSGRNSAGRVMLGGVQYDARFVPHIIKLTGADRYINLELFAQPDGSCRAVLSAMALAENANPYTQEMLDGFLDRLNAAVAGRRTPETADVTDLPPRVQPEAQEKKEALARTKRKKSGPLRTVAALLAAAALLCAAYGLAYPVAYRYFSGLRSDGAAQVSLATAQQILPGMGRSEVERLLGSTGARGDNGTLYASAALTGDSLPAEQILVVYDEHIVQSATYLNVDAARAVGTVGVTAADYPADALGVDVIAAKVGYPVSMLRRYRSDAGDEMLEVHFGRADCFANFDPAWRGEYVVTADLTQQTAFDRNWVGYDGGDPLLLETLDGTPAAAQYDSYTDFLNDKFAFDTALLALNHYSHGDAKRIFRAQDMTMYDDTLLGGTTLYVHNEGALGDGAPLYRYTFGFDSAGRFRAFSFTNLRLFEKRGALEATQYAAVTKGMSYNEVRGLVNIVPSALFVDENYFTVCYGRYVDAADIEEQFEFIVRFDISANSAQNIYNNVTKAAADDAAGTAGGSSGDKTPTNPSTGDQPAA